MIEQTQFPFQGKNNYSSAIINVAICIFILIALTAIIKKFNGEAKTSKLERLNAA